MRELCVIIPGVKFVVNYKKKTFKMYGDEKYDYSNHVIDWEEISRIINDHDKDVVLLVEYNPKGDGLTLRQNTPYQHPPFVWLSHVLALTAKGAQKEDTDEEYVKEPRQHIDEGHIIDELARITKSTYYNFESLQDADFDKKEILYMMVLAWSTYFSHK